MSKEHLQVFYYKNGHLEVYYEEAIEMASEVIAGGIILVMFAPFVILALFEIL